MLGSAASEKLVRSACTIVKHNAQQYDSNNEKQYGIGKGKLILHCIPCKISFGIYFMFSYVWFYRNITVNGESFPGQLNMATKMAKDDLCFVRK
jgi:hypothetical protein